MGENQDENDFKEEEDQFNADLSELKSVERYALRHLEWEQKDYAQDQLDYAQAEIEARKEEFDTEKLDELTQEMREELGMSSEEEDEGNTDDDDREVAKDEKSEQKDEFEISMLETDAEVPVEDLIRMYYPDQWRQMQADTEVEVDGDDKSGETTQVNGRRSTRS